MRRLIPFFLLSLSPVLLPGCELFTNPSAMPAGYRYHGDLYKAPPGPNSEELGYDYSAQKNEEILLPWREAVGDLVTKLEAQTGLQPQPLYIQALPADNAFNNTFDNVLREELGARGYSFSRVPGDAPHLRYGAAIPETADALGGGDETGLRDFALTFTLLDPAVLALAEQGGEKEEAAIRGQSGGVYRLPAYGYDGEGFASRASSSVTSFFGFEPVTGGAP